MKVTDLINALSKLPDNMPVDRWIVYDRDGESCDIMQYIDTMAYLAAAPVVHITFNGVEIKPFADSIDPLDA